MKIARKRILMALVFGGACVGCGFVATTLLPNSSMWLRAGIAGAVSGLVAAILMRTPWMRSANRIR
jgi:Fe-S cluster biogenesis protein NfuA